MGFSLYNLLHYPKDSPQSKIMEMMLKVTEDEQGMVAGLTVVLEALNDEHKDGASSMILLSKATLSSLVHNRERIIWS
jgi:hypothetical protein